MARALPRNSCRIYERLKAEREAETAHREEEDFLVNLMREEEAAERERAEAAARAARREAAKAEMIAANKYQMQLKVRKHDLPTTLNCIGRLKPL